MRSLLTIMRREFAQLAMTPAVYCVLAAVSVFYSFIFVTEMEATRQAVLQPVAFMMGFLSIFLVPVLTMRSLAGEENAGTIEILLTAPVRPVHVILGKFLGCWLFYCITLLPLLLYILIFSWYAEVDMGAAGCIAAGLLLTGAAQTAVGLLVSGMTANIIVAAAGGCVANFFFMMLSIPTTNGASVYSFPAHLSWWAHYSEVLTKGIVDTRSLVFYISFCMLLLFLSWLKLSSRGEFSQGGSKMRRGYVLAAVLFAIIGINLIVFGGFAIYGWRTVMQQAFTFNTPGKFWMVYAGLAMVLPASILFRFASAKKGVAFISRIFNSWVQVLAAFSAILIFVNVNFLSLSRVDGIQLYTRWDMTENQVNTLSPKMREAIDNLPGNMQVTVFLSERADYDGVELARRMRELLNEMGGYSPLVKIRYLDAIDQADEARELAGKMQLPISELSKLTVLESAGKRMVLSAANLLRMPDAKEAMGGRKKPIFQGELAMAVALRRLSDQTVSTIYFASGQGQLSLADKGNSPDSCSEFSKALQLDGFVVRPFMFDAISEIPSDCDLLVIAGAKMGLTPEASKRLEEYVKNGGRLLLLMSPSSAARSETYGSLLKSFFCRVRGDLVVDQKNNLMGQPTLPYTLMSDSLPFSTSMPQTVVVMPDCRSISFSENKASNVGWKVWPALRSVTGSLRLYEKSRKTYPGPGTVSLAAAKPAQGNIPETRVVIAGSAASASNMYFNQVNNNIFWMRVCRWLTGKNYNMSIKQRSYADYTLRINADGLRMSWYLVIVGLAELWLVCAGITWWLRRE